MEYSLTHGMFLGVGHSVFIVVYDLLKFSESKKVYYIYIIPILANSANHPKLSNDPNCDVAYDC